MPRIYVCGFTGKRANTTDARFSAGVPRMAGRDNHVCPCWNLRSCWRKLEYQRDLRCLRANRAARRTGGGRGLCARCGTGLPRTWVYARAAGRSNDQTGTSGWRVRGVRPAHLAQNTQPSLRLNKKGRFANRPFRGKTAANYLTQVCPYSATTDLKSKASITPFWFKSSSSKYCVEPT